MPAAPSTRVRRPSPSTHRAGARGPPAPRPGGPHLDAGALRQYSTNACKEGGKTAEGQGQERHSRLPAGACAIRRTPWRGVWGGRHQRHGQSAAAPVPAFVSPLGGELVRQGAASVRARCRADGGPEYRLAAQPCVGAVQRRRGISRCTDWSAGGCADWRTLVTTRARALRGPDAAAASPRRRASWRSGGRRWRGLSARATTRPCRPSAVETGLLTAARPDVSGTPLWREPRPPATALCYRLAA